MSVFVVIFVFLEYAFAMWIINMFAFRERLPLSRAALLTAAAWLAWSCIFALRARTAFDLFVLPLYFALYGIPVFGLVYWRLRKKWLAVEDHWKTFE